MKHLWMYIAAALVAGGIGGYAVSQSVGDDLVGVDEVMVGSGMNYGNEYGGGRGQNGQGGVNRGNCLADDCLLVEDLEYPVDELPEAVQMALDEALLDEHKALATYEAVIAEYGMVRPFSMIKGAEEQHIASLEAIYDKYGLTIPENDWTSMVELSGSLGEACAVGVQAEIANAALYEDELLPAVFDYPDITAVFTNLMLASENKHLPAFERCVR